MFIDFLITQFKNEKDNPAVIWKGSSFSYQWLKQNIEKYNETLSLYKIAKGSVISLLADYSPASIALMLSLIEHECIIVPLTSNNTEYKRNCLDLAQPEWNISINEYDQLHIESQSSHSVHQLYLQLNNLQHPGLVLFSSGSSGKIKASVHDFSKLLEKYKTPRHCYKTISFLLFDHIGGLDTLLYSLSNASPIVIPVNRNPEYICELIEKYSVEVLPTSPTFLNLLLLSEAYLKYDLTSLKYITYGTEVMPEYLLKKCSEIFHNVILLQKYGTTETGTLRSKSENSHSLWVKLGGEGFQTKIVDGILYIKAHSAMLGYLNAPSPFTEDGWFITGDRVETNGDYIKILGRESDIINVGGEKVYPSEVENVIHELPFVYDVLVYSEKNSIVGNIVCTKVTVQSNTPEDNDYINIIREHCKKRLPKYKVPVKVILTKENLYTDRYKKMSRISP